MQKRPDAREGTDIFSIEHTSFGTRVSEIHCPGYFNPSNPECMQCPIKKVCEKETHEKLNRIMDEERYSTIAALDMGRTDLKNHF